MPRKAKKNFPSRAELVTATFKAIADCKGSATNDEIQERAISILHLPDSIVNIMHTDNTQTKLQYELRWARTYLKKYGAINNSTRGVWSLSVGFENINTIDGNMVCQKVREIDAQSKANSENPKDIYEKKSNKKELPDEIDEEPWREELAVCLRNMNPFGFERLAMRLLRECGFSKVSVTKKTGDNGIDGFGKLSLNGIVSINVAFQCKRYAGLISNSQIRDFRGSLPAGIEKGIFITTGAFSNEAVKEAADSGKTPSIDLIDGEELINLLIKHELGIIRKVKTIYCVQKDFFEEI